MALTKIDDRGLKTPIDLLDNEKIRLGTGNDLELFHDGSNSYIDNKEGDLYIRSTGTDGDLFINVVDDIVIKTNNGGTDTLRGYTNGGVDLYFDGTKRFATHSEGTYHYGHSTFIIGDEGESAILHLYADDGDDNADKWRLQSGTSSDFYLQNYASGSWETSIDATANGNVRLMYDNSKKFETTSSGVSVSGNCNVDGNITLSDNEDIQFGNSTDFRIYHDGSHSYIRDVGTGDLRVTSNVFKVNNANNDETMAVFTENGSVDLYYDDSKRLFTRSNGITVQGNGSSSGIDFQTDTTHRGTVWANSSNQIGFLDTGGDWAIKHTNDDSTKFYVQTNQKATIDADGLKFGTDSAAANALDDYEEGSFSPTVTGIGGGTNPSFSAQSAMAGYTKVGNIVHCHLYIYDINCSSSGSNIMTIAGLPFASSGRYYPGVITHNTVVGNGNVLSGYVQANNNSPHFIPIVNNSTTGTTANTGNPKYIMASFSYQAQ